MDKLSSGLLLAASGETEVLKRFGAELKRRRENKGFRFAKDFAAAVGISPQYLSQIETAYSSESRPATMPDDLILKSISELLEWKMLDIRRMLGHIPDDEPFTRPMMLFLEQQVRYGADGDTRDLTSAEADQLVSELEELAGLRIAQVQRQGKA